jgi:TolB-like protein
MEVLSAGVSRHIGHHVELPDWVSEDLLSETRHVWSQAYDRDVDDDEALEILGNVRRLADVLWKARKTGVAA